MSDMEKAKALFFDALDRMDRGDLPAAEAGLLQALSLAPTSTPILVNLAIVSLQQNKIAAACRHARKAIAIDAGHVDAHLIAADCLYKENDFAAALATTDRLTALAPTMAEAHGNRGLVLIALRQPEDALASYERALALKPDYAEGWLGRGICLRQLGRLSESEEAYRRALALRPDLVEAWSGLGNICEQSRRFADAIGIYDRILALKPGAETIEGLRLHAKTHLCDWSNWNDERRHVLAALRDGRRAIEPLPLLALSSSASDQMLCAKMAAEKITSAALLSDRGSYDHPRPRIAYVSADFHDHPVARLLAGVIERHDRSRFETIAVSFGPKTVTPMATRLRNAFEHFHDVSDRSDAVVAVMMREQKIDIAVDLMGYTSQSRSSIFAARPCPVQVNFIGYPGTLGAPFIDYIIADRVTIPPGTQGAYSERVVTLPDTFQPTDNRRAANLQPPQREAAGLPATGFVFCCFNNTYKITPDIFDVWMRLLNRVEGSVLWMLAQNDTVAQNLTREAAARGIKPDRIVFAPRLSYDDYLARYGAADLFLDTLPFNAGTTASDALWAGLPIVTCPGQAFASRMAASLLTAIGMPELVTASLQDYEELAAKLAGDPAFHAGIKAKLARNRAASPLFDTARYTRHLEKAYALMSERSRSGEKPQAFSVAPLA